MNLSITSQSVQQTLHLGYVFGQSLDGGAVIAINGTLGAGKTHLTQGIARGLGIDDEHVVSPTYTLCIPYDGRLPLLHVDAYRIGCPEEVDELALDEVVDNGVVIVVEWASKIEAQLPPTDVLITIGQQNENQRRIDFESKSAAGDRVLSSFANQVEND